MARYNEKESVHVKIFSSTKKKIKIFCAKYMEENNIEMSVSSFIRMAIREKLNRDGSFIKGMDKLESDTYKKLFDNVDEDGML